MPKYKEKPRVFLDLDQTLISAEADDEYDSNDPNIKKKAKKFRSHNMDGYYIIFERPGLQSFLTFLFKNFTVSIWTAASKDYALFILDKVILNGKKNRNIDWIFFSYHCDISKNIKNGTKDLSILWEDYEIPEYSEKNTLILDDYDEVYKTQPGNCIPVIPFNFKDDKSEDDEHLKVLQSEMENIIKDIEKGEKPASGINKKLKLLPK